MRRKTINIMRLELEAKSVNESFSRQTVSAFTAQLSPALDELADIRCAVSEAVTNCVVHAYGSSGGTIYITVKLFSDRSVRVTVKDKGCGIEDVELARRPLYTTDKTGERGGMGFAIMDSFCDSLRVTSKPGRGTDIIMNKKLRPLPSERAVSDGDADNDTDAAPEDDSCRKTNTRSTGD